MYICNLNEKKIIIVYKLKKFYLINKNIYINEFILMNL